MKNYWKTSRAALILGALLIFAFLATIEWLTVSFQETMLSSAGVIAGLSLAALLFALIAMAPKNGGALATTAAAALRAITEVALLGMVVFALAAASASLLPSSLSTVFASDAAVADLIVFSCLGIGLAVAIRAWRRYADQLRKATAAQLQAAQAAATIAERDRALAEAQIREMRAQIEPHFLWNTLSNVQYLARKEPDKAADMTGHLIKYLRGAVPRIRGGNSTLGIEMDSVRSYLEIMRYRLGERLAVFVECPPELAEVPFAPLLLQTIVENAVKHGIEPKVGPVSVSVRACRINEDPNQIRIEVEDDGVGLQEVPATAGTRMGLRSVRDRLHQMYGESAAFSLTSSQWGGVVACITFPLSPTSNEQNVALVARSA